MAKIGAFVDRGFISSSTPADNITFPVEIVLGPPQNFRGGTLVNANIQTQGEAQIQQAIRTAVAAFVNTRFGTAFVAADVRVMDGSPDGFLSVMSVSLGTLAVADDIAQIPNATLGPLRIRRVFASARLLTLGTATVIVKNGGGVTVGSVPLAAPGPVVNDVAPAVLTILAGGRLRFGFTGLGTGLGDVTAGVWYLGPGVD